MIKPSLLHVLASDLPPDAAVALAPLWRRRDFQTAALRLSARLQAAGIRTAAVWFDDAARFACAVLAGWHAGVSLRLLPNLAADNLAWGDEAEVWLSDAPEALQGLSKPVWPFAAADETAAADATPAAIQRDISAEAEVWLKTSGSSGAAQLVRKTAGQMAAEAAAIAAVLPFDAADCAVIGSVSPQHMYGFSFRFALSLHMGWAMVREQQLYPETLLAAAAAQPKSVWIASPALLNRLVGHARNWQALQGRVAGMVSAGGALPADTSALLAQSAVLPLEIYGSTEAGVAAYRHGQGLWQPFAEADIGQNEAEALNIASPWSGGRWQSADLIERQAGGFVLLGRQDRIIKFEDKRVSLSQIEHEALKHPWLADAHCSLHPQHKRLALWAALNAEGITALRDLGRPALVQALKRHLAQGQDTVALPRYWRFTDRLPRNAQSKIAAAEVQTAFCVPQTGPVWEQLPLEAEHEYWFAGRVPVDLVYFNGHFASFPLVPGVIEVQWVRDLAARFDWGRRSILWIENLKYQQFIRPYDEVELHFHYQPERNKLIFKLSCGDAVCASGRMVFGERAAAAAEVAGD